MEPSSPPARVPCLGCAQQMALQSQAEFPYGVTQLKFRCDCGWYTIVLVRQDGTYDRMTYDSTGVLQRSVRGSEVES